MTCKHSESGRTLLETLAVLVVIAILLLASLAGYNFVIHKYKKDQTVKAISELAVRYKLRPVISKDGSISVKDVYPEAERADSFHMRTKDTSTGRVHLEADEITSFAVVVNDILDDTCRSALEKGEYDGALVIGQQEYNKKNDYLVIGKEYLKNFDYNKLTANQQNELKKAGITSTSSKEDVMNVICAQSSKKLRRMALVFGDKCPKMGASYWYQGKCWPCPKDEKEDKRGSCCTAFNTCGYCEVAPWYCAESPAICHNNLVCDTDGTKSCVECVRKEDCCGSNAGKICSRNHCCPEGQIWGGLNCVCPDDKPTLCGTTCCSGECSEVDSTKCKVGCSEERNVCQKCDDTQGEWVADTNKDDQDVEGLDVCHTCKNGEIVLKDEEKTKVTSGGCCKEEEEWLENQCCIPSTENLEVCKKTCGAPNKCQACNDSTGELYYPDEDKKEVCGTGEAQVCCKECNDDNTGCKLPTCEGTAAEHPCKKCNETTGQWTDIDDTNTSGLSECQKCESGEIGIDEGKQIPGLDCARCSATGELEENTSVSVPTCQKCDLEEGSSTRWHWIPDNTKTEGECGICYNGNIIENTSISIPVCQKCDIGEGSSTRWKLIPDDTNTSGLDACHICKEGVSVLKNETKATVCGEKCCSNACNDDDTDCKECVVLYKEVRSGRTSSVETIECCDEVVENIVGSLDATGYLTYSVAARGINEKRLYCCPKEKVHKETNTCCGDGYEVVSDGCCLSSKVYIEGGEKKCCLNDGIYGDIYDDGTKCCLGRVQNNKCMCPENKLNNNWDSYGCKKCEMVNGEPTYVPDTSVEGMDCGNKCQHCSQGNCTPKVYGYDGLIGDFCCKCGGKCNNWCTYCAPNGPCIGDGYENICSAGPEYTAGIKNTMCYESSYQTKITNFLKSL